MDEIVTPEFFLPPDVISQPQNNMAGFVKIWAVNKETGKSRLVVDKKNLILYSGATVLSNALSGVANSNISTFYVSYCNSNSFTAPIIDLANSNPISAYTSPFGYLRLPLSLSPSYLSTTNYSNNTALFTVQVASASAFGGAAFTNGVSNIFECALVATPSMSNAAQDIIFSRINFNPILFEASEALTIVWGVVFLCA